MPPDTCSVCSDYRESLDSWLDDEEPITITKSIEALQSTQGKVADTLERMCSSLEERLKEE